MRFSSGLVIAIVPATVLSQIITITERPSACSAIYTSGSSSVTVVRSTVTVAPVPFSDELINGGTPFVIEVQPGTAARRRQSESSMYITANGRTSSNSSEAVVYRILNGTLQSIAGGFISTDASSDSALFAISALAKAISTTFFSRDLKLEWNNAAFDGGSCNFYTAPADDGSFDVISYFRGLVDASWLAVTFACQPAGGLVLEPTTSLIVSTIISMGNGVTTTPAASTSPVIPTPTGIFTENGYCGASAGICDGIIFGSCCSQYGACGNTDEYCGAGCLSEFGVCDTIIASSSVNAGTSSIGPMPPAYSATVPQPVTSQMDSPSTSVFLSTSGSVIMTMTTMVPASASLPIYSVPGTPIGPINPPVLSTSTFVRSTSIPVVTIPTSDAITIILPTASSAGPGTIPPVYTFPEVATISTVNSAPVIVPTSSGEAPLPSFYSSPATSESSGSSSGAAPSSTPVVETSSDIIIVTSAPIPDTYPTTASVPALPTEESLPAAFSTTFTPEIASTTVPPPGYSEPPVYSPPPVYSEPPVLSSTPIPDTYPTPSSSDDIPSSTNLVLSAPVRCDFGEPPSYGADDSYCEIVLPQPMVLYGRSSVNTFASTNGVLSVVFGTAGYQNADTLPTTRATDGDNVTPITALFPFWDDLAIPEGDSEYGIYYQLSDTGVTYEYYLTRTGQRVVYHFTVEYTYASPGLAVFTYYEMEDPGTYATVGAQGIDTSDTAVGVVYSYQTGTITTGLVVICDTTANTCVRDPSSI